MRYSKTKDSLVIGFAMFAIFFGAGNLIFPPHIGLVSGEAVIAGLLGMTLTGILLPMMAVASVGNMGYSLKDVTKRVNSWWHILYMTLGLFVILFATVPRTGAVAYETGLLGIFPHLPPVCEWIFLIVFFGLAYILASNRSNVVEKIGKLVTPVLLISLLVIIVLSVIHPIGTPQGGAAVNAFVNGLLTAYNTGGVGTGLICAGIFIAAIRGKGYTKRKEFTDVLFRTIAVAFIILLIVYGGLYLMGTQATSFFAPDTDNTLLLVGLIKRIGGYGGIVSLSVAVMFACFTTVAGMIATGSDWVDTAFKGRIPYKVIAGVLTLIILFMASTGASFVIKVAAPIFLFIYPMSIVMTVLGILKKFIPNDGVWKGAIYTATLFSLYDAFAVSRTTGLHSIKTPWLDDLILAIPLAAHGFSWLLPTVIGGIIGGVIFKASGRKSLPDEV